MTRLAASLIISLLLICCSLVVRGQSFYTLQSSADLKEWNTVMLVTNDAPQRFLRLQQWQKLSWNAVSNAVSYTVWWTYGNTGGHIVTTATNVLVPAGVPVFVTAQDAVGNDSNPSNVFTL